MRQIVQSFSRNVLLALLLVASCCAIPTRAVTIDWATVGKPGNAPNVTTYGGVTSTNGAVGYSYSIAKNDVTVSQYVDFLNAKDPAAADALGLWSTALVGPSRDIALNLGNPTGSRFVVAAGRDAYPVTNVSWYSAARFSNWLGNGQGNGGTETGSYTLLGGTPIPSNAASVTRNSGATVVLPTVDEWYKAAYYDPNMSSYFLYPTSSNMAPVASAPASDANHANYNGVLNFSTPVGSYSGTTSPSGLFDMAGNVFQWTEGAPNSYLGIIRGSPFAAAGTDVLLNSFPTDVFSDGVLTRHAIGPGFGFRVALVPEPSTLALAAIGFVGLATLSWRRRKR